MAKPSDFYVGMLSFFAILLPGAVAASILREFIPPDALQSIISLPGNNAASWIAFLIAAYFLGHLIFLAGSYEADSKFFRSLLVVLIMLAIALFWRRLWIPGVVVLVLILPCFARYYERRLKGTTQAYIYIVTMYRLGKLSSVSDKT